MKMCLLIKVASGTNWNQGLMLAMINVGQEVELSHNEEKQSVIFRPFFHFLSPCYLSSWLSGTSIVVCVFVGKMMVQLGADRVVPFLRPIVLHQARRDVISLSQAHAPTMLHYLCVRECIFILQTMLHYMSLSGLPEHFFLSHYPVWATLSVPVIFTEQTFAF